MSKITKTSEISEVQGMLQMRLKYHPARVFTYLVLVGITSAFLFLSISYFATTFGTAFNHFTLPFIFHTNTIIMLVSSYSIAQARKAIQKDDWDAYMAALLITAGLGIAFTVFQIMGWQELMKSGIRLSSNVAGAYLYVISGLHLVHLVIGVALLLWFSLGALSKQNDPVKMLLFESNPFSKMKVDLLCTYWHFVDGLWLYIYLFFIANIYLFTKIGG